MGYSVALSNNEDNAIFIPRYQNSNVGLCLRKIYDTNVVTDGQ